MLDRLEISFDKNLNRLDFLKNQILALMLACISFSICLFGLGLIPLTYGLVVEKLLALAGASIFITATLSMLYALIYSISNIQGRFVNLGVKNKIAAWIIYVSLKILPYVHLLTLLLYVLPPGVFNTNSLNKIGDKDV